MDCASKADTAFNRFLATRGITKTAKRVAEYSEAQNDFSVHNEDSDHETFDFLSLERDNRDADRFYDQRREAFTVDAIAGDLRSGIDDSDESDVGSSEIVIGAENGIYDRNDTDNENFEFQERFDTDSQISSDFSSVELSHDVIYEYTMDPQRATCVDSSAIDAYQSECLKYDLNRRLENPQPVDDSNEELFLRKRLKYPQEYRVSQATKFSDSLNVLEPQAVTLENHELSKRYKNNLTCIISKDDGEEYLVSACSSDILVFKFDPIRHTPIPKPVLKFDTKPMVTSTTDRLISTWPYFPHTINYLKVGHFLGCQVLGACSDDGSLLVWYTSTIFEYIDRLGVDASYYNWYVIDRNKGIPYSGEGHESNVRFWGLKINPDFKLKLESSSWGLDFLSYSDNNGNNHNFIISSDNSQSLTLFYYHEGDHQFHHSKTHQLLHNIPDVSFLSHDVDESGTHSIMVTCCSISGELINFKFRAIFRQGPLNVDQLDGPHVYYVDPAMQQLEMAGNDVMFDRFKRVVFSTPRVTNRVLLSEDCWTVRPVSSTYFKPVDSLAQVTGDPEIDNFTVDNIIAESLALGFICPPEVSSELGMAANWQQFQTPIPKLFDDDENDENDDQNDDDNDNVNTTTTTTKIDKNNKYLPPKKLVSHDDTYRRIEKGIHKLFQNGTKISQMYSTGRSCPTQFLMVSTSLSAALFRLESLFCNGSSPTIFDLRHVPPNTKFANRMSLSHIIPELSCMIVVTQQGFSAVLRLCQYRGVYGFRLEHLFAHNGAFDETITGISVRNISTPEHHRYVVYITATGGETLCHYISENNHGFIQSALY